MKKVRLGTIKVGQKFRYGNSLFIRDNDDCIVNLTCGRIELGDRFHSDLMVTPIKVLVSDIIRGATYA